MSRRWRQDEVDLVSKYVRNGGILSVAAELLWRRKADVIDKAKELRERGVPGAGMRKCLVCGGAFHSHGVHNRLCSECRVGAS